MSGITPYSVYTRHFIWIQFSGHQKFWVCSDITGYFRYNTKYSFHRKRDNTWNTQIYPREDRVPNWKFQHSYPTQTRPILKIKTYPLRPGYRISQWHYQSRLNHSNCHLSNPKTQSALKLENMTKGQIYTVDAITGNCFMQQSNCEIQRIGVSVS